MTTRSLDLVGAIRRESEAFARAADRGDLGVRVPSCPEWSLGDLVWHLTDVQWFWTQIASGPLLDRDQIGERPGRGPDDELVARFRAGAADLANALGAPDAATPIWSWAGGRQDVAWARRRQAHEAVVHRWDAEAAVGQPTPIERFLALDGVDEWVEWMVDPAELATVGPMTIRLAATDIGYSWTLVVRADGSLGGEDGEEGQEGEEPGPHGTVEGPASDLDLALWRRVPPGDLRIAGDRSAVERFLGASDLS